MTTDTKRAAPSLRDAAREAAVQLDMLTSYHNLDVQELRLINSIRATLRASLAAPEQAAEPVAWPRNAEQVRDFIGSQFCSLKYGREDEAPCDQDLYSVTAHDLLSAFSLWETFECATPPSAEPVAWREAVGKLGTLRPFLLGWRDSEACKRNSMQEVCDEWIAGLGDLFEAYDATPPSAAQGEGAKWVVHQIAGDLKGTTVHGEFDTEEEADAAAALLGSYWAGTDRPTLTAAPAQQQSRQPTQSFAQSVVVWMNAREFCEHYHGFKENDESVQCSHPDQRDPGDWCSLNHCPRMREEGERHGVA